MPQRPEPTFDTVLRKHLHRWARDSGLATHLEARGDRSSLVLRPDQASRNLFDPSWWSHIEGKEHVWARALNSSQCFAVNLFGPLHDDRDLATRVFRRLPGASFLVDGARASCVLEFTPEGGPAWLGERGQPTQVDAAFLVETASGETGAWLIEVKLSETKFGNCRGSKGRDRLGKGNPAPERCCRLAEIVMDPVKHCWMAETEGRTYWNWIQRSDGSFDAGALTVEDACPFRHGLYQLMRNRVLADAMVAQGGAAWARVSVCIHPGNDSARRLPEPVAGSADAVDAFRRLTADDALGVLDPRTVVDTIESEAPAWAQWVTWVRGKYLLEDEPAPG